MTVTVGPLADVPHQCTATLVAGNTESDAMVGPALAATPAKSTLAAPTTAPTVVAGQLQPQLTVTVTMPSGLSAADVDVAAKCTSDGAALPGALPLLATTV